MPNAVPTQQTLGGRAQQQHYIANPMQQQVQPHTPLTPQQSFYSAKRRLFCTKTLVFKKSYVWERETMRKWLL